MNDLKKHVPFTLASDFSKLQAKTKIHEPLPPPQKKGHIYKLQKTWPASTQYTESILQNITVYHAVSQINSSITKPAKDLHRTDIKGHKPLVADLKKTKKSLRKNNSLWAKTIKQIQTPNNTITSLMTEKQTALWQSYLMIMKHKSNNTQLWQKIEKTHNFHINPTPAYKELLT